jgi:hypothetical protein
MKGPARSDPSSPSGDARPLEGTVRAPRGYSRVGMPVPDSPADAAIAVRAYETRDEPRVLELLQAAFGRWPRDVRSVTPEEFFRWKHRAGPFGGSKLVVAEADGALVGCHAYMPWLLTAGASQLLTLRGVDLAVHPAYRRLGVSMAMRGAARFPEDVALMWSHPNKQNRPGAEKAGMQVVARLDRFLRPRRPLRRTLGRGLARGRKSPDTLQLEAASAAEVLAGGGRVTPLLGAATPSGGRMATVKDLDYLRWRYGRLDEYRAIWIDSGEGGLAVVRTRRHGSFWVSDVCDVFAAPGDRATVRRLLRAVSDAGPADLISCNFSSPGEAARSGFVQARGATVLMTLPLRRDLVPDPAQRASWQLSRGDLELL